jgi:hypothetical protein
MPFHIVKRSPSSDMWLKRLSPTLTWGPREQACRFQSKAEAAGVARRLADQQYVEVTPAEDLPL